MSKRLHGMIVYWILAIIAIQYHLHLLLRLVSAEYDLLVVAGVLLIPALYGYVWLFRVVFKTTPNPK